MPEPWVEVYGRGYLGTLIHSLLEDSGFKSIQSSLLLRRITHPKTEPTHIILASGPGLITPSPEHLKGYSDAINLLLDSLCKRAGSPYVLYISSGGVMYGDGHVSPISEENVPDPQNDYGRYHLQQEGKLALAITNRLTIFRLANPYGRYQSHKHHRGQGLIPHLLDAAKLGKPVTIYGDGETTRDYLFDLDISDLLTAWVRNPVGGVFNVGSGKGTSINELIEIIQALTMQTIRRQRLPARNVDVGYSVLDVGKAGRVFGWRPKTGLEEGLRKQLNVRA